MESMMPVPAAEELNQNLRETNARLCLWLDNLTSPTGESRPPVASPKQIAGLLAELMRAGERLRTLPALHSPELQQELARYRKNVERLRDLLPSIQRSLLAERARLEQERSRLESAADWIRGSRQTL
jgi:hypothetical protein